MALEGRICLSLKPPKEFSPEKFVDHPDVQIIKDLLALDKVETLSEEMGDTLRESASDDEESEEETSDQEETLPAATNKFSALQGTDD